MTLRSLRRRVFAVIALTLTASQVLAATAPQPNIILILADDLGIETIGSYGGESFQTPELDRMAAEGMRFENTHAQPLCTPSRVKLMTGKYNFRNYQHFMYLDPSETTFAHTLKQAGYRTMISGKWQLVDNGIDDIEGMLPQNAGFDDYFLWQVRREDAGSRYWGPSISDNGKLKAYSEQEFGPDLFNKKIINYISNADETPFFIYHPMVLPHLPLTTTPDSLEANGKQEIFAGMMGYMDKLVGQIRSAVINKGIADNTVILFVGDNGTNKLITSVRKGVPVTGGKGKTTDNGTHVPFIAWWPNNIAANSVDHNLINFSDFFPTLMELAGIPTENYQTLDGISLVNILKGKQTDALRTEQFIHYNPLWFQMPARYTLDQQWKLYDNGKLFNTLQDADEKHPVLTTESTSDALKARTRLTKKLINMPGGPVPSWPTAPKKVYGLAALTALVLLGALIFIGFKIYRRKAQK